MRKRKIEQPDKNQDTVVETLPVKVIDEFFIHSGSLIASGSQFAITSMGPAAIGRSEHLFCKKGNSNYSMELDLIFNER